MTMPCPICIYYNSPLKLVNWTHHEDGGTMFIGADAKLYCKKCGATAHISKWGFICPEHQEQNSLTDKVLHWLHDNGVKKDSIFNNVATRILRRIEQLNNSNSPNDKYLQYGVSLNRGYTASAELIITAIGQSAPILRALYNNRYWITNLIYYITKR